MNLKSNLKKRLRTLKKALNAGLITPDRALDLFEDLQFEYRIEDVLVWGQYYFPDKFTLPFCEELHRYIIEIAEEPFTSTLAPRGHAKTTISCFLIPLYIALNFPQKYRHFLNIQATSTKAIAVNLSIRHELEQNELLIRDYGEMLSDEKCTERQFVLKSGIVFTAIGSGESMRGINYRNIRPDYVIGDDLYDEDSIENIKNVRKINSWFWSSVYKCVANDKFVCIHIQGTAISREDLMHDLSKRDRWKFKKFQAVTDFDKGLVLWFENKRNTIAAQLADREEMGSIIYSREMQNELRDDESSIIKLGYIQYIDEIPADERVIHRIGAIDPAEKTKEVNDFTGKVGVVWTENKNVYVIDAREDKLTFDKNKKDIEAWHSRYEFDTVPFETNKAFGLFEELKRTTTVPVRERIADKDKITRLIAVSHMFENGKVFFLNSIPKKALNELVDQLVTNFPAHDDMRDALVLCIEEAKRMRSAFVG